MKKENGESELKEKNEEGQLNLVGFKGRLHPWLNMNAKWRRSLLGIKKPELARNRKI